MAPSCVGKGPPTYLISGNHPGYVFGFFFFVYSAAGENLMNTWEKIELGPTNTAEINLAEDRPSFVLSWER